MYSLWRIDNTIVSLHILHLFRWSWYHLVDIRSIIPEHILSLYCAPCILWKLRINGLSVVTVVDLADQLLSTDILQSAKLIFKYGPSCSITDHSLSLLRFFHSLYWCYNSIYATDLILTLNSYARLYFPVGHYLDQFVKDMRWNMKHTDILNSMTGTFFTLMRLKSMSLTCSHAINQLWHIDCQVLAMPVRN